MNGANDTPTGHGLNDILTGHLKNIFLDRDGVINRKPPEGCYISRWSEFHLLPGVEEAIAHLNRAGLRVLVVTNQRGIARGIYSADDVTQVHCSLQRLLAEHGAHIDAFYFCPHDIGQCSCRKPLPGLFHQAIQQFPDIRADNSMMIGDSLSDIEFGKQLGMPTIFIQGEPERQKTGATQAQQLATRQYSSLAAAVDALLNRV